MEEYALIMRHEDGNKIATPEQIQEWRKQTSDWINAIKAHNKFVSGTGLLFEDAKVVKTESSRGMVIEGPFGISNQTVGGFIIIKADSVGEAVEFAKGCPVLQGDGNSVEVRKIAK
ncbi:MAG: YciI family protein [Bacteroidales bacterium]|jgi:hypothetical protein